MYMYIGVQIMHRGVIPSIPRSSTHCFNNQPFSQLCSKLTVERKGTGMIEAGCLKKGFYPDLQTDAGILKVSLHLHVVPWAFNFIHYKLISNQI